MAVTVIAAFTLLGRRLGSRPRLTASGGAVAIIAVLGTLIECSPGPIGHAGLMGLAGIGTALLDDLHDGSVRATAPVAAAGTFLALGQSTVMLRLELPPTPAEALMFVLLLTCCAAAAAAGGYLQVLNA